MRVQATAARLLAGVAATLAALALAAPAGAAGTAATAVDGGTPAQRAQVQAALNASSFDWSVIPVRVRVHLVPGVAPHSSPANVWLDPRLLDTGRFSWAVIQDEFAHQIDFYRLDEAARAQLNRALGTSVWCHADDPALPHSAYGCERFTALLVWAYWPAPDNAYRPVTRSDESAAAPPARFRELLGSLLQKPEPTV